MDHSEVIAMMEEIGLPYAYDHFAEGESPNPPFLLFLYPESNNFGADNIVYHKSKILHVELYTDKKDPELEEAVETVFDAYELYYESTETWIETERLYEVLYELNV